MKNEITVIIKNVTGEPENEGLILELARCGRGENTVIKGTYNPKNNSVQFYGSDREHCVAWLGQTCEKVKFIPRNELKEGMVFFSTSHPDIQYVLLKMYDDSATLERLFPQGEIPERHGTGYGWFDYGFGYVRTMGKREFAQLKKQK